MKKTPDEIIMERFLGYEGANRVEWERYLENSELMTEVKAIQKKYGLPLPTIQDVIGWMDWLEPIDINREKGELIFGKHGLRREKLLKDLDDLRKKYDIPSIYKRFLQRLVTTRDKSFLSGGYNPFPELRSRMGKDGKRIFECLITPETDFENPLVIELIKRWQLENGASPPQPVLMRGDKRKLDWRLVWAWHKRHPDVTITEIAKSLSYNRVTVSRELNKIEKEYSLQKLSDL